MDNTGLTKKFIWVFPCNTLQNKPFGQPKCWIGMGVFPHKTILHKQEARFDLKAIVCTPLVCRLATLKMWHELIWWWESFHCVLCLVAQLCLTLCDHMNCSLPCSSVHGDLPGKNTRVGCHALLQGIFLTRDWTQVSHIPGGFLPSEPPGKPKKTAVGSLSLLQGNFLTQESNQDLLHCRWILYQLSYQGSPLSLYMCISNHYNVHFE